MFFLISKLLHLFILPLTWILVLLTWSLISRNSRVKKRLVVTSFLLLMLFSNPFVLNTTLKSVEYPIGNFNTLTPSKLGVILTGFTQRIESKDGRVFMGKGSDRATHMVYLYNRKIVSKILVSGGSGALNSSHEITESQKVKNILVEMGVRKNDILIEQKSRNTYENAKYSAQIINEYYPNVKPILITSSSHMKRSVACFKKQGIEVQAFAGDYNSKRIEKIELTDFIPSAHCLSLWSSIFHEWVGIVSYKLLGYA